MAKDIYVGEVILNSEVKKDFFLLKIGMPDIFSQPIPGQFVMIRQAGRQDPFLSRPISIYSFRRSKSKCSIELLYRVVGKGTQVLSELSKGSKVEICGPLGNGFSIASSKKKIVLIAGGIGVAPLSHLAQCLHQTISKRDNAMTLYLGAHTANALVGLADLQKYCDKIILCTDDGTEGERTLVTNAFLRDIKKYPTEDSMIYACGPKPMIGSLATILNNQYHCQVSLEEKMACGVGACMGCVVAIRNEFGEKTYKRVCVDGPVFSIQDIIWEKS